MFHVEQYAGTPPQADASLTAITIRLLRSLTLYVAVTLLSLTDTSCYVWSNETSVGAAFGGPLTAIEFVGTAIGRPRITIDLAGMAEISY
jgi:hypothetical protein